LLKELPSNNVSQVLVTARGAMLSLFETGCLVQEKIRIAQRADKIVVLFIKKVKKGWPGIGHPG
jgi:hypothetical protein